MRKLDNRYKETKQWHVVLFTFSGLLFIWVLYQVSKTPVLVVTVERQVTATSTIETVKAVEVVKEVSLEDKIKEYFPRSHVKMIAIAQAESGMSMEAENWNCYYKGYWKTTKGVTKGIVTDTKVLTEKGKGDISTWCRSKADRQFAHSVDCGVLGENFRGLKACPQMDVDKHLRNMAELSKTRGFKPWSSYLNGEHEKYLATN